MKNLLRLFLGIFAFLFFINPSFASVSEIHKLIKSTPLDNSSVISISVKEVKNGADVFAYNEKKLLHPASTLKVFTMFPSVDVLGNEYSFNTTFYVDGKNNLYIKSGADPLFSSADFRYAAKTLKSKGYSSFNTIFIDDSITDDETRGTGWMSDDSTNSLMQPFGAFNTDDNLYELNINVNNSSVTVSSPAKDEVTFINKIKKGNTDNISVTRADGISPEVIVLSGTASAPLTVKVPPYNLKRFYIQKLSSVFKDNNVKFKSISMGKVPTGAKEIASTGHDLKYVLPTIFKDSNNKNAETVFKVAGGKFEKSTGSITNSLKMFYEYWKTAKVDTSDIIIADGSGVSRNNLVTTDFMTNALNALCTIEGTERVQSFLARPGEGTLSNRLLNLRGNVWLKTGTLANISGITGLVLADNGKIYSVAILIQNFKYPQRDVKKFENDIITAIKNL